MANIRHWLEEAETATGERIEAIVVGKHDDVRYGAPPLPDENALLSREDGLRKLDREYYCGYGGEGCFPMYAWTPTRVYFISECDDSTCLSWLPRHPVDMAPNFSGEG